MRSETIAKRRDLAIRRLVLEPGEAMPWHSDACHRFSVIVRGEQLTIEYRDGGERVELSVHPGMVDWNEPDDRVHRGVNTGSIPYEEVVIFLLGSPGMDPQPEHPQAGPRGGARAGIRGSAGCGSVGPPPLHPW